jgi:hypothetical protein
MKTAGLKKRRAESRDGWIVTTVALEPEMHRRLSLAAVEERAALTELVRDAVGAWLAARSRRRSPRSKRT